MEVTHDKDFCIAFPLAGTFFMEVYNSSVQSTYSVFCSTVRNIQHPTRSKNYDKPPAVLSSASYLTALPHEVTEVALNELETNDTLQKSVLFAPNDM